MSISSSYSLETIGLNQSLYISVRTLNREAFFDHESEILNQLFTSRQNENSQFSLRSNMHANLTGEFFDELFLGDSHGKYLLVPFPRNR